MRRFWIWIILALIAALMIFLGGRRAGLLGPRELTPFECYATEIQSPKVTVGLTDQFRGENVTVADAEWVCVPVLKKELLEGKKPQPIRRGDHLQCYSIDGFFRAHGYLFTDQFVQKADPGSLISSYLCEPADKEKVVEESTTPVKGR